MSRALGVETADHPLRDRRAAGKNASEKRQNATSAETSPGFFLVGPSFLVSPRQGRCYYGCATSGHSTMDLDVEELRTKLAALKIEHRDLDEVIAHAAEHAPFDQLRLRRLKKRKLWLKDQISKIESELLPDIIA
jgi:hypothetical protein